MEKYTISIVLTGKNVKSFIIDYSISELKVNRYISLGWAYNFFFSLKETSVNNEFDNWIKLIENNAQLIF